MSFLPMTKTEMDRLGWEQVDIILVSGDAYIDHPSFGAAIIGRYLEKAGYKVGIIAQPDWHKDDDFLELGKPRLFFGVTAGNMDSMVNHYTAQKKIRSDDAYSPDNQSGKRPDRATIIYTNALKRLFKGCTVIIGGIEASLRRIAHYDFWSDTIKNSVLADSKADMLVYGMAEKTIVLVANELSSGTSIKELKTIPSTVVFDEQISDDGFLLPSAKDSIDKQIHHNLYKDFYAKSQDTVLYQYNGGRLIRHNPPEKSLSTEEIDGIYDIKFENAPHPSYQNARFSAWEQIRDSITTHRGCYGGCNFCAIGLHQGRNIQSRSQESIIDEIKVLTSAKTNKSNNHTYRFTGTISDVGGPTANMYGSTCRLSFPDSCRRRSCLFPKICPNLIYDHSIQLKLLHSIEQNPAVKHIFISSGIRFDMAISQPSYIKALAKSYTGGRLKLAPEHVSSDVLKLMGKPNIDSFLDFSRIFLQKAKEQGLKRQIIPYIIIGHPGTGVQEARELGKWLKDNNIRIEQVQEFTPTPMTVSTCMYYTGLDFETGKPIFVPKGRQIREQKEIAMWWTKSPPKTHR